VASPSTDANTVLAVPITVSMIMGFWRMSLWKWEIFLISSIATFTTAICIYPFLPLPSSSGPTVDFFRLILFGLLMTLQMGIGEAFRVVGRLRSREEFILPSQNSETLNKQYTAGSNIAIAIFLPLYFLTILHPTTTWIYLFWSILILSLTFMIWILTQHRQASQPFVALGVLHGLILPVIIMFTTKQLHNDFTVQPFQVGESLGEIIGIIMIYAFVLKYIDTRYAIFKCLVPAPKFDKYPWTLFFERSRTIALAAFISCLLLILVSLALLWHKAVELDSTTVNRLKVLQVLYSISGLVFSFIAYGIDYYYQDSTITPNALA